MSAGGDDDGLAVVIALQALQVFDITLQLNVHDGVFHLLGAEMLSLFSHSADQGGAGFLVYAAGIVLNLSSDDDLAAVFILLDNQGIHSGAASVATGGESSRTRADNNDIINFFHIHTY